MLYVLLFTLPFALTLLLMNTVENSPGLMAAYSFAASGLLVIVIAQFTINGIIQDWLGKDSSTDMRNMIKRCYGHFKYTAGGVLYVLLGLFFQFMAGK